MKTSSKDEDERRRQDVFKTSSSRRMLAGSICVEMSAYVKYFDKNNQYIDIFVHDKELLKQYNEILDKIKDLL